MGVFKWVVVQIFLLCYFARFNYFLFNLFVELIDLKWHTVFSKHWFS